MNRLSNVNVLEENDQTSAVCSWSNRILSSKYGLSSEDRQSIDTHKKKKKIKKETLAVRKSREQLYMNMFWQIPGSKAEPQGVSEEVVPRKDTKIFREPQWRLQSHSIITQDELQWLVNDFDRFTLRCKWFLTRVTKDIKANELDHVITTWQNHLHSSNSSYRIRRRVWVTQFIHCKTNAATSCRIICTWR